MTTDVNIAPVSGNNVVGIRHTFVYARLQLECALTRDSKHLVGAYGVVGFSGVKDARKSVFACRRYASADSAAPGPWLAGRELDRSCTNTGQNLCKHWTFPRQLPGGW